MTESTLADSAIYLRRLGFAAPPPPTLDTLRQLQPRHTAAFAFESLSTLLHRPVPIDLPSLERKILHDGRGGYCFELNRLYLALLRQLGFEARGITARVLLGRPEDAWTARTHFLALVTIDGVPLISDVGFGGMTPTGPLRLDTDEPQPTPRRALSRLAPSRRLPAARRGRRRMARALPLRPAAPGRDRPGGRQVVRLDASALALRRRADGLAHR